MNIEHPFQFDPRGHTAEAGDDDHVRDLIEQVLFTAPGERVNRPTFGSGLLQLVFAAAGDQLATTVQMIVQASLQQWLGDKIVVEAVQVDATDSTLTVAVQYVNRLTGQRQAAQFRHGSTATLSQPYPTPSE
jgi:phage baseplate assembly protein W